MPSLYAVMSEEKDRQSERIRKLQEENEQLKKPIKQVLFNINNLIDKYASNSDKMSVLLELKEMMIDDFGEEIL